MDSEEHLVGCRTAGVVRCRSCRTVRRRPIEEQFVQQMMLALRGTPWDAKGRLATPVPTMGGLPPPTAAASSATRGMDEGPVTATGVAPDTSGAVGSTDQPMAEKPEDLPEGGEQDIEGAELRPEKRARGRPLRDISHPLYFVGCSACAP
eukprot:1402612-Amphidinium_carterae.1